MSFDALQDKLRETKTPIAAGLDARLGHIPPHILEKYTLQYGQTLQAAALAAKEYDLELIDALSDVLPAITLRTAGFEALGWRGMQALEEVVAHARRKGLYVIADAKRGDSGHAGEAYAAAWLGAVRVGEADCPVFDADCVTVTGYMGSGAIAPFLEQCAARDKAVLLLVKSPDPSSIELQDLVAGDRLVYHVMGDLTQRLGKGARGRYGFNALGAVVGSAQPGVLKDLRRRLPDTFFLVTGYGGPGGDADNVRHAFNELGRGAVVEPFQPITSAWLETGRDGEDFCEAALAAVERMRLALKKAVMVL